MSLPRLLDEKQVNLSTRLVRPILFLPRYHIHYHAARKTKMLFAKRCSFSVVCLYCFSQNIYTCTVKECTTERHAPLLTNRERTYLGAVHDNVGTSHVVFGAVVHGVVLRCLVPEGVR